MKKTLVFYLGFIFCAFNLTGLAESNAPSMFKDAIEKIIAAESSDENPKKPVTAAKMAPSSKLLMPSLPGPGSLPGPKPIRQKKPINTEKLRQALSTQKKAAGDNTIYTGKLKCRYTRDHSLVWTDAGSGAALDIGIWRPKTPKGWVRVGDVAINSTSKSCPNIPGLLIEWDDAHPTGDEKGPFLARPVKYELIWNDKGSGAHMDGSFWYPVPPNGYVTLGFIGNGSHNNPADLGIIRCVRRDLVYPSSWVSNPIYTDRKSGADKDVSLWSFTINIPQKLMKTPHLHPNTFLVSKSHDDKPKQAGWVLQTLSPQDAFNDALNGYLNTTGTAFVQRTMLAVENANNDDNDMITRQSDNFKNAFKTTPEKTEAAKPQAEQKLEGGETAAHPLPQVKFSSDEFTRLIKDLGGAGEKISLNKIPGLDKIPFLENVAVEKAVLSQGSIATGAEQGQPWLCIDGNVSVKFNQFKEIDGRIMLLTRLYKQTGLRTGFVITLPTKDLLAKLGQMGQAPLKLLKLSDTAITYATEEHEWQYSEVPERLKKDFAVFADNPQAVFPFAKGEGAWMTAEVKQNTLLDVPFKALKTAPAKVMFNAIFPQTKDESFKIRAQLLSEFNPSFLPVGKFFEIGSPDLEIKIGDFNGITMIADLSLKLSSNLNINVPVRLDFPLNFDPMKGISVSALIPGIWQNAMGIKGFSIGNLGIAGSFGKMPSLGLNGIADLGDGWKFDLSGALSFSSPVALSALMCRLNRDLGLGDLVRLHSILAQLAFPKMKLPDLKAINLPLLDLKVRDPYFCVAEQDIEPLKIRAGITCSGTLMLGATDLGACSFWMNAEKGIQCKGWISPFKLGPLALSGAGPDKKDKTADDSAVIDLEYHPLPTPPYDLQQHCYISARADIGNFPLETLLEINKESLRLNLNGDFGSSLRLMLNATGDSSLLKDLTKGASLQCEGKATSDFIDKLEKAIVEKAGKDPIVKTAVSLLGNAIIKIRSITFKGSLSEIAAGKLPNLEIKGAIFGMSFSISDSMLIPASDLLGSLVGKISDKVVATAKDLVKDPIAFIGNAAKEVIKLGEDVSAELIKAFKQSPEQTWKDAQESAKKAAEEAKKVAEAGAKVAAETVSEVVSKAENIAKNVAKTMEDIAKGAWDTVSGWF